MKGINAMKEQFERTNLLLGEEAIDRLQKARVMVFGVGGVGGHVCEALVRSGVGEIDLVDNDTVSVSNINRQIIATHSSVGKLKVEVMRDRLLDINPEVIVNTHACFFLPENADTFHFEDYDYVVDCIDTVTGKIELIMRSQGAGTPIISAMGAGNKLDPSRFKVADIYKTDVCPLAKTMRRELKKRGVKKLKVVFSDEKPIVPISRREKQIPEGDEKNVGPVEAGPRKRDIPGSTAFVPAVAGMVLAGEVIRDLAGVTL